MADKLISADALKAALQGLYQVAGWEKRDIHFSLSDMECNIDFMPTIEAEPVKHGHWIVISEYPKKAECSYCGYPMEHELVCWWDYCPNCGAKMDLTE